MSWGSVSLGGLEEGEENTHLDETGGHGRRVRLVSFEDEFGRCWKSQEDTPHKLGW